MLMRRSPENSIGNHLGPYSTSSLRRFEIKWLSLSLRLKIAQKPYIVWSLGPKALKYESLEPKGIRHFDCSSPTHGRHLVLLADVKEALRLLALAARGQD